MLVGNNASDNDVLCSQFTASEPVVQQLTQSHRAHNGVQSWLLERKRFFEHVSASVYGSVAPPRGQQREEVVAGVRVVLQNAAGPF